MFRLETWWIRNYGKNRINKKEQLEASNYRHQNLRLSHLSTSLLLSRNNIMNLNIISDMITYSFCVNPILLESISKQIQRSQYRGSHFIMVFMGQIRNVSEIPLVII